MKPLAVELYECYRNGRSVLWLALEFGIPMERAAERIWAGAVFTGRSRAKAEPLLPAC